MVRSAGSFVVGAVRGAVDVSSANGGGVLARGLSDLLTLFARRNLASTRERSWSADTDTSPTPAARAVHWRGVSQSSST